MNALLIEDDEDARELYRSWLHDAGFKFIDERQTVRGAIALLNSGEKYDLIVLDLKLPDSEPSATFPAISSYSGRMPIFVITGNPACMKSDIPDVANGMLCKPFQRGEFIDAAKSAMVCKRYKPLFPVSLLLSYDLKNPKLSIA